MARKRSALSSTLSGRRKAGRRQPLIASAFARLRAHPQVGQHKIWRIDERLVS